MTSGPMKLFVFHANHVIFIKYANSRQMNTISRERNIISRGGNISRVRNNIRGNEIIFEGTK